MEHSEFIYKYRLIARIVIEAQSPIAVGTGNTDVLTDSPVAKDINGLPFIPATSIAGILRHALNFDDNEENIFGFQDRNGGKGSEIVFSDAMMIGADGKAVDGISDIDWSDEFYRAFQRLPIRQHVCINDKGIAKHGGKFDNEIVFKGTRFVFEIELYSKHDSCDTFHKILSKLYDETLRIGGGTRHGYGELNIVSCKIAELDLSNPDDLHKYINKSSCLSQDWEGFKDMQSSCNFCDKEEWTKYELTLSPIDFFMFGSGNGDDEADNIPMAENVVAWNDGLPKIRYNQVVVPATSVKGALAHRTAYHYNRAKSYFIKNADTNATEIETEAMPAEENDAVASIFGSLSDKNGNAKRGNILISDIVEGDMHSKLFYHNHIDSFTGGTIDGALFQEKCVWGRNTTYSLKIIVKKEALQDEFTKQAFEQSLHDLYNGMLPLGGITNRGNGIFNGTMKKD